MKEQKQEFEKFPVLANKIQKMVSFGNAASPADWNALLYTLNQILSKINACRWCEGIGCVVGRCCDGRDCGCYGEPTTFECLKCNGSGVELNPITEAKEVYFLSKHLKEQAEYNNYFEKIKK